VESVESKVERGSRQDPTRDPVKVGCTRTSTTDRPPRRDVGRHSVITTFLLQPTTKGPTQLTTFLPCLPPANGPTELSHHQPTNEQTNKRTFKSNQRTSSSPTLSLYPEDGVVIF